MTGPDDVLMFPFRDERSWKQFLIACGVMLAGFIVPLLPMILLMGYIAQIMRAIILEKQAPGMPTWQGSNWSEMFADGLRLFGAQFVLMAPLYLPIIGALGFVVMGAAGFSSLADQGSRSLPPVAGIPVLIGIGLVILFAVLSAPYRIVIAAAQAHVAARRSFAAAFEFRAWWGIFRAAPGKFLIAYVVMTIASFAMGLLTQIAALTLVLLCILPLFALPFSVYQMLISNALYAQAYATGQECMETR